ncbi:MAG: sodium:proton antiporter [Methanobacteriota archaeon]|nr:MAG: sodium:proton antiporter [Euryarchaeota archaeon]
MTEDIIVKTSARLMTPFIQMFGLYVIFHGHLTPGGGFQGGAIIGASMILLAVVYGLEEGEKRLGHDASTVLESSTLFYALIGLIGIAAGYSFLANRVAGIPVGTPGALFSGGAIFAINIVVGLKVASTGKTLFYALSREERP